MKVFVTGGTGYVGGALVQALLWAGHEVTATSRSESADRLLSLLGATPVRGFLGGLAPLAARIAEHDAAIHAAVDYRLGAPADAEAIDALLDGARQAGRPFAVVYTSGVWVLGETAAPATEAEPIVRPAAAVAWRPPHEKRVLEAATDRIATAVVRPGVVFGERRGLVAPWFASAVKEGRASFVGTGDQRWALVHRADLAELYRLVVERRARGIFHGVDGASPRVAEAAAAASRAAGRGGVVRAIPVEEARRTMGPMADALAMDQVVVSARGAEVGWAPRRPPFPDDAPSAFREWSA
ncbi:MAG TPA: NAD-dependent epimerase/dehydratase family protein [Anaeromyxobacter sp.]|nr:NAD-dependent epimerase/dehydratase family protein [Anaeromyxobacter sp.]